MSAIPFVVIAVLAASLAECFLVLPGHLSHALKRPTDPDSPLARFRTNFDLRFDRFRQGRFRTLITRAIRNRYSTIAIALAAFMISIAIVIGGRVGYQFFPSPEPDKIYANVEMVSGARRDATREMVLEVEQALFRAAASYWAVNRLRLSRLC